MKKIPIAMVIYKDKPFEVTVCDTIEEARVIGTKRCEGRHAGCAGYLGVPETLTDKENIEKYVEALKPALEQNFRDKIANRVKEIIANN